ncbi:hypothetical protein YC2023_075199 [Brassica napus]
MEDKCQNNSIVETVIRRSIENNESNSKLKDLEVLTSNTKQVQADLLEKILRVKANTEYLRHFLHGSSDKGLFKKNVPVATYEL